MKYDFLKYLSKTNTVLEKEKYKEINHLLDEESISFLYTIGLPNFSWIGFIFENSDEYTIVNDIFLIGNNGRKYSGEVASYIGIDLLNEQEVVLLSNYAEKSKLFLGLSLKHFILTLFEFEMFMTEICPKEYFGDRHDLENRKVYIEYLRYRLHQIDKDFFFNDRNYYWGSILEEMENGVIRIV